MSFAQESLSVSRETEDFSRYRAAGQKLIKDWGLDKTLINGRWRGADSGKVFDVSDPGNDEVFAQVPLMEESETYEAIQSASDAFEGWAGLLASERGAFLKRWADLLEVHQEELATLITLEQGKPFEQARREVVGAMAYAQWYSEEAKRAYGQTMPAMQPDRRVVVQKHPVGVVAAITPWNFPLTMVVRKCAPAMAAGCTVVVKPAEDTPLSAIAAARLAQMAGLPDGVLNVVTGLPKPIAKALCADERVRMLSFTGSTEVGKTLMMQCAPTVKKLSLELGGNAPFIVMDDADISSAVRGAMISKFRNSGQTCVCANRIFVQDGVYDAFVEEFIKQAQAQKIGYGFKAGIDLGPLINPRAVAKTRHLIEDACLHGGQLHYGAEIPNMGSFVRPLVITGLSTEAECFQQEWFSPVAPIFRFSDEDEVLAMANSVRTGLSSYLYSRDIGRITRIVEKLETGVVGINDGTTSHEGAPFGGVKESGQGREGGHWGLEEYLEPKYLNFSLA